MKRIALFLLTNLLVIATVSIVTSVLGIQPYLNAQGIDYVSLMIFCGLWGMAGSFISLLLSKKMAKWTMGVKIIDPSRSNAQAQQLVHRVDKIAKMAGLPKCPEVGVYDSPEVNAFATGPSKSNALVAVSSGLLNSMNDAEVEGVLAHEVAHIANGDMVTMTLIQGVVNAFVMFFARIAAFFVSQFFRSDEEEASPWLHFGLVFLFDILFGILGSMVVCAFSRTREYHADRMGAQYVGIQPMVGALEKLKGMSERVEAGHKAFASLKIAGHPKGLMALLMTHPPLEKRIAKLRSSL